MITSQQQADEALAIYRSNRDDQERMDTMLREYFAKVRADEYSDTMRDLRVIWGDEQ